MVKLVVMVESQACRSCSGSGHSVNGHRCPACSGTGKVDVEILR